MPNKTWLVFRMQFTTFVFNFSFLLILVSMPLLSVFSVVGLNALNLVDEKKSEINLDQLSSLFGLGKTDEPTVGFVDQSGMISQYPKKFSMRVFEDETGARQALEKGEIAGLYILTADYLKTGSLKLYEAKGQNSASWLSDVLKIESLVNFNLLEKDSTLAQRIETPLSEIKVEYLSREARMGIMNMLSLMVPVGMAMLFYLTISSVASLLFESLVSETSNQTIEVLMTSLNMRQLLVGKVLALGVIGLILEISWVGLSALGFALTGKAQAFSLPITLTPDTFFWAIVFFILGYAMYSAVIISVGALVQRLREQWQIVLLIMMPLFVPVISLLTSSVDLNTPWWIFLSMFPLTSPVGMFARLILTNVPWWQVLLSIAILLISSYYVLRLAVRLFRSQYLLSPHPWLAIKQFFGRLGKHPASD